MGACVLGALLAVGAPAGAQEGAGPAAAPAGAPPSPQDPAPGDPASQDSAPQDTAAQDTAPRDGAAPREPQAGARLVEVRVRVQAAQGGGRVLVDHGAADGLAPGDAVRFRTREGAEHEGVVMELDERTAVVELLDPSATLEPGTPGAAYVTRSATAPAEPGEPAPEPLPWQTDDEGWKPHMPLLARIEAVRPEARETKVSGRTYLIGDFTDASQDDRSDSFLRLGGDVLVENPFGRGGEAHVDVELNHRTYDDGLDGDESTGDLRVDRLSYAWGGTRFDAERWEVGRFLQHGMPEFGLVDGVEYGQRLETGHRWGVSAGFMPEPDPDQESGHDFQIGAWYEWVLDPLERLTAAAGAQKTWHDGASDRELLVGRVRFLPEDGWDLQSTVWVDHYGSRDDAKGSGLEITQAHASAARRFDDDGALTLAFRRVRFPELDRDEFVPVVEEQLADDRYDRLSLAGWRAVSARQRIHGGIGAWDDEDDSGGDGELGIEIREVLFEDAVLDLTLFGTAGRFATVRGGRVTLGRYVDRGRWDLLYELTQSTADDFPADADDQEQHRVRASRSLFLDGGWSVSGYAEALLWDDDEHALSAGLYVQRSF